jgi:hypothetical protein
MGIGPKLSDWPGAIPIRLKNVSSAQPDSMQSRIRPLAALVKFPMDCPGFSPLPSCRSARSHDTRRRALIRESMATAGPHLLRDNRCLKPVGGSMWSCSVCIVHWHKQVNLIFPAGRKWLPQDKFMASVPPLNSPQTLHRMYPVTSPNSRAIVSTSWVFTATQIPISHTTRARSRAYRWGEDGFAGFSDEGCDLRQWAGPYKKACTPTLTTMNQTR